MKIELNASYLFDHFLRKDLARYLGPGAFKAIHDYYEECEPGLFYDYMLFAEWLKGTPEEIYREHFGDCDYNELRRDCCDDSGTVDPDELAAACAEVLERLGVLLEVTELADCERCHVWKDYRCA